MELPLTESLTNPEIAARMGISKDTLENYMVKAVASLKELGQKVLREG